MTYKLRVIRTYANGLDGDVVGYAKRYANGQWVFSPSVASGKKPTGKRFRKFEDCIPKWAGGVDSTRSEVVID